MKKIIVALAATLLSAGPVAAATAAPTALDAHIRLTATRAQGETVLFGSVWLDCPGGERNHPHARAACADLQRAGGDFDRLPGGIGICSNDATPVTVTADGTYRGREVHWERTFVDECALGVATGRVFDF
ncbi:SSI family serine proteinase inhibitor [Streptomyces sp. NPDC015661]|uniref:SSI family serine proteinase inhibitor n=1 Tax=Streptomyces sp. NPDC015661 TaxID=3364961 RepID=UPI00370302C7